jgi:hypothetical protein
MAYKKVIIAVDCENENEQKMVQEIAKELSETLRLKAKELINFYPFLQKNRGLIYTAIDIMSRDGKKGLLKLVPLLVKQL